MPIKTLKYLGLYLVTISNIYSQDMNNFLDEATNFTTKTNLNIDYQPSVLTVLHGQDLEHLGIQTLSEALDFVPGLQPMVGTSSSTKISVRGNAQSFNGVYEKIKFFINGVDINANYYSDFPIALIQRIEVLRGGVSAIYGQNGFIGAINIITKSATDGQNSFSFGTGNFKKKSASATLKETFGNWDIGLDSHYLKHNKKVDAPSAKTTVSVISGNQFDRKYESLEGVEDKSVDITIKNGDLSISSMYFEKYSQNNYGFFGLLDFNEEGYTKYTTTTSQIDYQKELSQNNTIKSTMGILKNNYQLNTYFYKFEPNLIGFKDPQYIVDYTKQDIYGDFSITNKSITNHKMEFGVYLGEVSIPKNNFSTNADAIAGIGYFYTAYNAYFPISKELTTLSGTNGFLDNTKKHNISSYSFHDLYNFNENLNFSFDYRVDDYEGFKKVHSYHLGSVYSNDNANIYKIMISKSYRVPSLIENSLLGHIGVMGNNDIKPENVDTLELAYIYIQSNNKLKLNFYYSIYNDMIDLKNNGSFFQYYNNTDKQKNYGVELEYSKNFQNRAKLLFNGSYTEFLYKNKMLNNLDINTPIVSKATGNLGYIYPLSSNITLSGTAKYYGTKALYENNKIDSVVLCNISLEYLLSKNAKVSFGSKNIFNTKYYYYGYDTTDEKMLREGTNWTLDLSYEF